MKQKPPLTSFSTLIIVSILFSAFILPMRTAVTQTRRGVKTRPGSKPPAQAEPIKVLPVKAKRWALVIGVDEYEESAINSLKGAANDAEALRNALIKYAGFPEEQVVLLATGQPTSRRPTRAKIVRALSDLRNQVPADGLLLVAFSGHGVERGGRAYLLPEDVQSSDDLTLLEDSAIDVERLKYSIRMTGVKQVIILIDACRNDPAAGRSSGNNPLTEGFSRSFNFDRRNDKVDAFVILQATQVGERAYEYREKQQGYFTWAFVEGLKGAAADERGEITLGRLVDYVEETVPKLVRQDLGTFNQQRPFATIVGYKANSLVVAVAQPAPRPAKTESAQSEARLDAEVSFWETIKNSINPEDFRAYLKEYPNGRFISLANIRLRNLDTASVPVKEAKPDRPILPTESVTRTETPSSSSTTSPRPTRPVANGVKMTIKGVVVRRDNDTFDLEDTNGVRTTALLKLYTSIKTKGFLGSGVNYGQTIILRGLKLEVEGRGNAAGQLEAEKVRFEEKDLRAARAILPPYTLSFFEMSQFLNSETSVNGTLSEILDKRKVYVSANDELKGSPYGIKLPGTSIKWIIIRALNEYAGVEPVDTPEASDFIIHYDTWLSREHWQITEDMFVIVRGVARPDGSFQARVIWKDHNTRALDDTATPTNDPLGLRQNIDSRSSDPEYNMTLKFINALKKLRGEK